MTERSDDALLDKFKDLVAQLVERFGPKPSHPIFTWSWYALPNGGYLVLPSHVPMPVDPIEPPFNKVDPPTPDNALPS